MVSKGVGLESNRAIRGSSTVGGYKTRNGTEPEVIVARLLSSPTPLETICSQKALDSKRPWQQEVMFLQASIGYIACNSVSLITGHKNDSFSGKNLKSVQ